MSNEQNIVIPEASIESPAFRLTPVGIEFLAELNQQEWAELGTQLGSAGRSIGFLIGDWLNYGDGKASQGLYSKSEGGIYHDAIQITGLDYNTLRIYARVSRDVARDVRTSRLSFEHHRKIAPLKSDEEKQRWLQIAEKEMEKQNGKTMSSRRLAKSILLGRVVSVEEMRTPDSDRGVDNVHPHVNRLIAFWRKMKQIGFLEHADPEQIQTMIEDLQPVLEIVLELRQSLADAESEAVDIEP